MPSSLPSHKGRPVLFQVRLSLSSHTHLGSAPSLNPSIHLVAITESSITTGLLPPPLAKLYPPLPSHSSGKGTETMLALGEEWEQLLAYLEPLPHLLPSSSLPSSPSALPHALPAALSPQLSNPEASVTPEEVPPLATPPHVPDRPSPPCPAAPPPSQLLQPLWHRSPRRLQLSDRNSHPSMCPISITALLAPAA